MASKEWEHKELERIYTSISTLQTSVNNIQIEIAVLKVKSGIWGAIGGVIPLVAYFLLEH